MNTFDARRTLLPCLAISVVLALGMRGSARGEEMNLSVSFQQSHEDSTYPQVRGELRVTVSWTIVPPGTLSYRLLADGQPINAAGKNSKSCSGRVIYDYFPTVEDFDAAVHDYLNRRHTYTVEAQYYDESSGSWKYVSDDYAYVGPDIMTIGYKNAAFPYWDIRPLQVSHDQSSKEGFDSLDLEVNSTHPMNSGLVSILTDPEFGNQRILKTDARPKNSRSDLLLELRLISAAGDPIILASPARHELRFSFPNQPWGNDFPLRPVTIQQYDPQHPTALFPLYDVKKLVENNEGVLALPDLQGSFNSGQPFAYFRLCFTRLPGADINGDRRVDLRDFSFLARDWNHSGPRIGLDLGGPKGWGAPDGRVDAWDLQAFCWDWAGYTENFESGRFAEMNWVQNWPAWTVTTTTSHSGHASAQAAAMGNNSTCSVMVTLDCTAGSISFWRRVSSQRNSDFLRFRIWPGVIGEWSGELGWQKVCIPVSAGRHTFAWEYVKDDSGSGGADTAWIDDITFPREQRPKE